MTIQTDLSLRKIFSLSAIYGITPFIDKAFSFLLLPLFTRYLRRINTARWYFSIQALLFYVLWCLWVSRTRSPKYTGITLAITQTCFRTSWFFILFMNTAIAIPICLFSRPLATALFDNKAVALLIVLVIANITVTSQAIVPLVAFRANEHKYSILSVNLLSIFTRVGLTGVFLVWLHLDLVGIFLADLCANVVTLFIYIPRPYQGNIIFF